MNQSYFAHVEPPPHTRPAAEMLRPAVLLVDDQPARLLTYESVLEGVGVECVRAFSGRQALECLLRQEFAVIVLDVSMPEMDGFETARLIREHPRFERTPLIFVTGVHLSQLDTLRGYEVGAIDYIGVPIVPEILRSKVALLVELYRRRTELEALNQELEAGRTRLESEALCQSDADCGEKEWLSALLNSMSEEVYFTDTRRRYTYANPAALREFGHASLEGVEVEQMLAQLEVLRIDGTPRPPSEAGALRALAGEVVCGEEHMLRNPRTGEWRHRQVSAAPVRDRRGTIIGSVCVVRDVTEQRRAERRKDEFLAMLAHELRNPLVPIRNGVELLRSAHERPELLATIRPIMERQLGHMVRLIDDLLDVSRITLGKIELQKGPVSVASLVDSALEAHRAEIVAGQLQLTVELDEPQLLLDVDATRIAQVIANLLQNAVKFTPAGGRILIRAVTEPGAGEAAPPRLVLKICDSGVGISAAMLPRVFEPFVRETTGTPGGHAGLGIGLTLARRLVELHGGSIEASSAGIGRGSEFTIRLPVIRGLQRPRGAPTSPTGGLVGLRVLIVDDNRDGADATAMLLEGAGAETRTAYDGVAGLAAAREFKPSVILLDIGMPGMDGYETCRRIRAELGADIGVVAISGWGQERDKRAAVQAGFDAHLTKPADPGKVGELLRALSGRTGR